VVWRGNPRNRQNPRNPRNRAVPYRPLIKTFHMANDRPSEGPIWVSLCTSPHGTVFSYPTFALHPLISFSSIFPGLSGVPQRFSLEMLLFLGVIFQISGHFRHFFCGISDFPGNTVHFCSFGTGLHIFGVSLEPNFRILRYQGGF